MTPPAHITILGGGPAGSSAALAALAELRDAAPRPPVRIIERARLPRHKVCGEFLSPEIEPLLKRLGCWDGFLAAAPALIDRMLLSFEDAGGRARRKEARLPEAAWGLSRYRFDALLLDAALAAGAELLAEPPDEQPTILACGRQVAQTQRGDRPFGFKAHFSGSEGNAANDAVELYFFDGCYVGVNAIEDGRINVCGLASEQYLQRFGFDYDQVIAQSPALSGRLANLARSMDWLSTGPLVYGQAYLNPDASVSTFPPYYPAGDALSFVDPFTGSGLLAAVTSGSLAGAAAARGDSVEQYLGQCRHRLKQPFAISSILRGLVDSGWAARLLPLAPASLLFSLTRPR